MDVRKKLVGAGVALLLGACGGEVGGGATGSAREHLVLCRVAGERDLTKALRFAAVSAQTSDGLAVELWQLGAKPTVERANRVRLVASFPAARFAEGSTWEGATGGVTLPPHEALSGGAYDRATLRASARSLRCAELRVERGAERVTATCAFLETKDPSFFELGSLSVSTHERVDVETWGDRLPPTVDKRSSDEFCAP